jgi:hypothetical protein
MDTGASSIVPKVFNDEFSSPSSQCTESPSHCPPRRVAAIGQRVAQCFGEQGSCPVPVRQLSSDGYNHNGRETQFSKENELVSGQAQFMARSIALPLGNSCLGIEVNLFPSETLINFASEVTPRFELDL